MPFDERFRWLLWLSLAEVGTMLVFSNYSALLPIFQKEWTLTNSQAGWIYSSYQMGYISAVVVLTSLTDYLPSKSIYLLSSFWSGIAGISFSLFAEGFYSALILRTLMGIGFAGTYMPGLRMVSEKFPSQERGLAVGVYVGAFTLGVALSLFMTGLLNSILGWKWAFFMTSLGPIGGGCLAFFKLGKATPPQKEMASPISFREVLKNRPALRMILGYAAHMWEMFGMRGWMVAFLTACFLKANYNLEKAVSLGAMMTGAITLAGAFSNTLGGFLSDRYGRAKTIVWIMISSSFISCLIGWTIHFPIGLILTLSILYGLLVVADSSSLSTGVTELAHPGGLGKTMALQSFLGWTSASVSPILFGFILDLTNPPDASITYGYLPNWGWAFLLLGIGGGSGILSVWKLKK